MHSWLQIQRFAFDSRRYQIFWEVVELQRGWLGLVSTNEELRGRNISGSGLENRDYGSREFAALTTRQPSIREKLILPTIGGRLVGIVRSRTKATELLNTWKNASSTFRSSRIYQNRLVRKYMPDRQQLQMLPFPYSPFTHILIGASFYMMTSTGIW
jgi:hypothetical protein